MRKAAAVLGWVLLLCGCGRSCASPEPSNEPDPRWAPPVAAVEPAETNSPPDEGPEEIWKRKCQGCHGKDGRAQTKAGVQEKIADFCDPTWQGQHSDAAIRLMIGDGSPENKKMKAYRDKLTSAQIDALVQKIRRFSAAP